MLILGISGGNISHNGHLYRFGDHDCSVSLVKNGALIAADEQERLDRIKHSNSFPTEALRACLDATQLGLADVDAIALNWPETYLDTINNEPHYIHRWAQPNQGDIASCRHILAQWLKAQFGIDVSRDKFIFPAHHETHAMATFARSGMDSALVVVLDGRGEQFSGTIYKGDTSGLTELYNYPISDSLGMFYLAGTVYLGYSFGDEYKVMGLAPHGNPETHKTLFSSLYRLHGQGTYELYRDVPNKGYDPADNPSNHLARACTKHGLAPRKAGTPFANQHKDFAAALQSALEQIVIHLLTYWQAETGLRQLCFSGGVAHNSSLNGTILKSGLFDSMYVHPASHDGGASEGAALVAHHLLTNHNVVRPRLRTASFGPGLGERAAIRSCLDAWKDWIRYELSSDIVTATARLVAANAVVGWAQGRSEFGPRALGNRSIVADPRPKENQARINAMVKKRERFRPFAPVTIAAAAQDYFELPKTSANYDFMSYVVNVRPEYRKLLGAVTHIDGTARIQIVDRDANPLFHDLVVEFGRLTGVPVLLNTSFNNNAEPIVQSTEDAIACFLSTNLDYLAIDYFLVTRNSTADDEITNLIVDFTDATILTKTDYPTGQPDHPSEYIISRTGPKEPRMTIPRNVYELLGRINGERTVGQLVAGSETLTTEDLDYLIRLWHGRFIRLTPA